MDVFTNLFLLLFALIILIGAASEMVESSIYIAKKLNIPKAIIGATILAYGTSSPEILVSLQANLNNEASIALGNVIGSNLFNLLAIMGISSIFGTIIIPPEFFKFDIWFMLFTSLLLIPMIFKSIKLSRIWGLLFVLMYISYLILVINRGS